MYLLESYKNILHFKNNYNTNLITENMLKNSILEKSGRALHAPIFLV